MRKQRNGTPRASSFRDALRKVHLASHMIGSTKFAFCGDHNPIDFMSSVVILNPDELVWVPLEFQCQRCHKALATHCDPHGQEPDYETCDGWSATPLMRTAVETALLSFARLATDLLELRRDPQWRHRCWFDTDRRVCACGRESEVLRVWALLADAGDNLLRFMRIKMAISTRADEMIAARAARLQRRDMAT